MEREEILQRGFMSPEVETLKVPEGIEESTENLLEDPSTLEALVKRYQLLDELIKRKFNPISEGSGKKNSSREEIIEGTNLDKDLNDTGSGKKKDSWEEIFGEPDLDMDLNDTEPFLFQPPFMYVGINATWDPNESKIPDVGKTGQIQKLRLPNADTIFQTDAGKTSKGPKNGPEMTVTTQPDENKPQVRRNPINYVLDRTNVTLLLKGDPFMQRLMKIRQKKKDNFIKKYNNKVLYSGY